MERAGRLIARMTSKSALSPAEIAAAAWPAAVGKRLAERTKVVRFDSGRVTVEVEDELWRKNLMGLKGQILGNLRKLTGLDLVDEIHFQVAVPRRPPMREDQLPAAKPQIWRKARA
jgi:predicted nucleic acid-binding Zn ribbon protein